MTEKAEDTHPDAWVERGVESRAVRVRWGFIGLLAASWLWAFFTCIPYWDRDPNYAFGWSVPPLMAFFLWRRLSDLPTSAWTGTDSKPVPWMLRNRWLIALAAFGVIPVEVFRNEFVQSTVFLYAVNLWAVGLSLAASGWLGGRRLAHASAFPILFFLTAIPWPGAIAQHIQQGLMKAVAEIVASVLLWIGIPVTLQGAQLHMDNGVVGIVEACSGIRSLQTSIMVGLAIGELHLLTRPRRIGLLGMGMMLAFVTNLGRTFTLCWVMERHGDKAMHDAHDPVGNVAMYSLIGLIYLAGRWLETPAVSQSASTPSLKWTDRWSRLNWDSVPDLRPLLVLGLALAAAIHGWYFALRVGIRPQVSGRFVSRTPNPATVVNREFSENVWAFLGADSGEQFDVQSADAPNGKVSFYHLFWKPGPKSLLALTHRPDACMPGAGWIMRPGVERTQIQFDGTPMEFLVFTFDRTDSKVSAIQLWGNWRNGKPVEFDFGLKLREHPESFSLLPSGRHLMGVEVLSAFATFEGTPPGLELFQREIPNHFRLNAE